MSIGIPPIGAQIGVGPVATPATSSGKSSQFVETLKQAVSQAEGLQTQADKQVEGLLNGEGNDVHSAMIAVEKANLSFQLMMQVRNKIVDAYQEIARMPF
jgi:flagellar hook-basal body complex protein FliE